jgi:chemotaxis protein methyltransferase CheR
MRDSEFDFIRTLVYDRSRISLSADKRELVSARVSKRLRATRIASLAEYCRLLQSPDAEEEQRHLIDAIATNHTFFFRENAHFEFLAATVVPEMMARLPAERRSRLDLWSAACSTGEEPYSMAMTLLRRLPPTGWHIEATDISHRVIDRALAGIYPADAVGALDRELQRAHFQRGFGPQEGFFRIKGPARENVSFHYLNLLAGEPPFRDPFHVIFCRNVMIYFDRPTQEELVARLARRLVPGGYLFVGHAESLTNIRHGLRSVRPAIYQKAPAA